MLSPTTASFPADSNPSLASSWGWESPGCSCSLMLSVITPVLPLHESCTERALLVDLGEEREN